MPALQFLQSSAQLPRNAILYSLCENPFDVLDTNVSLNVAKCTVLKILNAVDRLSCLSALFLRAGPNFLWSLQDSESAALFSGHINHFHTKFVNNKFELCLNHTIMFERFCFFCNSFYFSPVNEWWSILTFVDYKQEIGKLQNEFTEPENHFSVMSGSSLCLAAVSLFQLLCPTKYQRGISCSATQVCKAWNGRFLCEEWLLEICIWVLWRFREIILWKNRKRYAMMQKSNGWPQGAAEALARRITPLDSTQLLSYMYQCFFNVFSQGIFFAALRRLKQYQWFYTLF